MARGLKYQKIHAIFFFFFLKLVTGSYLPYSTNTKCCIIIYNSYDTLNAGISAWSQGTIAALLTSVTVLIFACFITGFICCCLWHKNKQSFKIFWTTGHTNEGQQFPNRVSVTQDLEMIENVAYGQVQSRWQLHFSELFTN